MTEGREKRRSPEKQHPLEGKYMVVWYTQCDFEDESTVMVIQKVENGMPHGINMPSWDGVHAHEQVERNFFETLAQLKKDGVTEMYFPDFHGQYFLGQATFSDLDEPETTAEHGNEVQQWIEFKPMRPYDSDWKPVRTAIKKMGLEVKDYTATKDDMKKPPTRKK